MLHALDITVLGLEASCLSFQCHCLLHEGLLAILLCNAATEELCGALDDGSHLGEVWWLGFAVFLLIVSLGIQHRTHSNQLQISLEFSGQLCLGKVEPVRSSGGFLLKGVDMSAVQVRDRGQPKNNGDDVICSE